MTNNKKLLGKRIKQIRKNAGYTQEKLSELIGIETGSLSGIESGRSFPSNVTREGKLLPLSLSGIESGRSFPSLVTLEKIAKVLNVKLKTFFEFETNVTIKEMKEIIKNNLNKVQDSQIPYIYKYFDGYME